MYFGKQFQIIYNWTEPFICQPTSVNIQQLNEQADKKECPFCSPGMERRLGNCFFCEDGIYSDGKNKRCAPCALSTTVPIKEVVIDSWIGIGKAVNVSSFCVSLLGKFQHIDHKLSMVFVYSNWLNQSVYAYISK